MSEDTFDPWWRDGICAEIGSDLFFMSQGNATAAARQACRICPVRQKCLADALTSDNQYGIFGGFGPVGRKWMAHQVNVLGQDPMDVAGRAIRRERTRRPRVDWARR